MQLPRLDRRELAAIYAGGVVGALARVGLAQAAPHGAGSWPWATFAANMAGALLLGYFVTRLQERLPPSSYRRPVPRHRPLRSADHLLHPPARAVRDARRGPARPRRRLRSRDARRRLRLRPPGDRGGSPHEDGAMSACRLDRRRPAGRRRGARPLPPRRGARRARRRALPGRHARRQPQRRRPARPPRRRRPARRRADDRRRRRPRLLHDLLDLDVRVPPARRGRARRTCSGSTSASRSPPGWRRSPSATGWEGPCERGARERGAEARLLLRRARPPPRPLPLRGRARPVRAARAGEQRPAARRRGLRRGPAAADRSPALALRGPAAGRRRRRQPASGSRPPSPSWSRWPATASSPWSAPASPPPATGPSTSPTRR